MFSGLRVGGDGDDTFFTSNPFAPRFHTIRCGPGIDVVNADIAADISDDCELVTIDILGDDTDNAIVGTRFDDVIARSRVTTRSPAAQATTRSPSTLATTRSTPAKGTLRDFRWWRT